MSPLLSALILLTSVSSFSFLLIEAFPVSPDRFPGYNADGGLYGAPLWQQAVAEHDVIEWVNPDDDDSTSKSSTSVSSFSYNDEAASAQSALPQEGDEAIPDPNRGFSPGPRVRRTKQVRVPPAAFDRAKKLRRTAAVSVYRDLMQGSDLRRGTLNKRFNRKGDEQVVEQLLSGIPTEMHKAMKTLEPIPRNQRCWRNLYAQSPLFEEKAAPSPSASTSAAAAPEPSSSRATQLQNSSLLPTNTESRFSHADNPEASQWTRENNCATRGDVLYHICSMLGISGTTDRERNAKEKWRNRIFRNSTSDNVNGLYSEDKETVRSCLFSLAKKIDKENFNEITGRWERCSRLDLL